jgi:hypothetical protein
MRGAEHTATEHTATDCRTPEGIAVGLVDTIIVAARVLAGMDLSPTPVRAALADLSADEDVRRLVTSSRQEPGDTRLPRRAT